MLLLFCLPLAKALSPFLILPALSIFNTLWTVTPFILFGFVVASVLLFSLHFQIVCEDGENGYCLGAPAVVVTMTDGVLQ